MALKLEFDIKDPTPVNVASALVSMYHEDSDKLWELADHLQACARGIEADKRKTEGCVCDVRVSNR